MGKHKITYDTRIESVVVRCLDLDFERQYDMLNGTGIIIDNPEAYDSKKRKNWHGLQSEFWGTDFGDENAFQERYSCPCHKYTAKVYNGMICDQCGGRVEYREPDVTRTGWIVLKYDRKVLSPIFARKLSSALGQIDGNSILDRILRSPYRSSTAGPEEQYELREKELQEMKKHPFIGKGMTWLRENLDTVLDYYEKRKPTKAAAFAEIRAHKSILFTSGIPVFSSILRIELPGEKNEKLFKMRVNTYFQSIIQSFNKINKYDLEDGANEKNRIQIDKILASAQREIDELFESVFKIMDGKHGVIQSKVIGGRYDWCSRNIITPNSGSLKADEIEIPYIAMLELFRYEICNLYCKIMGVNMAKANQVWRQAKNHFNPTIYSIMKRILEVDGEFCNVLLNRNPSINYGSFMMVHIRDVKKDFHDKALTLSTTIIQIMNADSKEIDRQSGSGTTVMWFDSICVNA